MKKFIYAGLLLFTAGSFLLASCEYDYVKPDFGDLPDQVSFATHIIPVFNASCNMSGCHATGQVPPDLTPAKAYQALISGNYINKTNPESSVLYVSMATGSMKPFSKPNETALVLAWIKQGAKNN